MVFLQRAGLLVAITVLSMSANLLLAQPGQGGGPGGQGGRGGFGGGFGANSAMLLMNPKVQEELELVEDQKTEIESLQTKMRETMQSLFSDMRNGEGDRQQMMDSMRTKMEEMTKDFETDINEILLPNQQSRLKQLMNQMKARGRSGAGTGILDNEDLKKELNITAEQEEKMRAEAEKAQEFVRAETLKIQQKALEKVLGILDSEQRKKYEEMVGDQFDFGSNQFGRGGPGGQGGGQGGGRGGRGGGGGDSGGNGKGGQSDF